MQFPSDFQQFQERMFEISVSYVSVALCNGSCVCFNTGQCCGSVKNGLSSTRDQVRLFKTVSKERGCPSVPKSCKEKNKVHSCSTRQGAFLILFGLLKYCKNQPSYWLVVAVPRLSLTWKNKLYFNHHLNLSATEMPTAPSSCTFHIRRLCWLLRGWRFRFHSAFFFLL